ncbi:MAG: hypothetical protein AB7Q16_24025 [Vicinamibacterales bacterium]
MRARKSGGGASMPAVDYRVILADLRRRRDELDAAIRAIAALAGEPVDETIAVRTETMPAPAETTRPRPATKTREGETTRPTDALSEAAIRTALKHGHDTPKALKAATKLKTGKLFRLLAGMMDAGIVTKTGQQRAVRYSLA